MLWNGYFHGNHTQLIIMQAQANHQTEKSNQSENKLNSEKSNTGGVATFQFSDNRQEAVQLQKIQTGEDNTPRSKQIAQLQLSQDSLNIQRKINKTGLPDDLKSGIENLSGYSMDQVKVHYNSNMPAQLQAHAYAQGTDIHVASGQEKHLPHEAWHVVQQMQGRVNPTMQLKGNVINDDVGLEKEADVFGRQALQQGKLEKVDDVQNKSYLPIQKKSIDPIQRATIIKHKSEELNYEEASTSEDETQEVGTEMKAILDPKKPVQGTGTTTQKADLYASLRTYYPDDKYVQGHLLNARLGGQAKTENLFPITEEANKRHAAFELVAKQMLISEYEKAESGQPYSYVGYNVTITEKSTTQNFDDSPNADIDCDVHLIDRANGDKSEGIVANIKSVQSAATDGVSTQLDEAGWGYAKTKSGKNATGSGSGPNETIWYHADDIIKLDDFKAKFPGGVPKLRGGRVRKSDGMVLSVELM